MERTETTLKVSGMTCPSCVTLIAKTVEGLPGVMDAHGNLAAGTFQFIYDATQVKSEAIIQAVEKAGELGEWQHTFAAEVPR